MRRISRTCLAVTLLALAGLPLAGCGGSNPRPKGQVLQDGQPYKLADDEQMTVTFNSTAGKGSASAVVSKDGAFTVDGDGLAPGPYAVSVTCALVGPNVPAGEQYRDKFNGFFTGPNDPLKVDVGPEASPFLEIDLGKKTVTKK